MLISIIAVVALLVTKIKLIIWAHNAHRLDIIRASRASRRRAWQIKALNRKMHAAAALPSGERYTPVIDLITELDHITL